MLLYYQPWMFYMHLYAILYDFRDKPINLEPSASFYFFLVFNYRGKGKSNRVQLTWNFMELIFGPEEDHGVSELEQESPGLPTRVGGAPTLLGAPLPRGQPEGPPTYFFLPYIPIYPKNFGEQNRSGVPSPPKTNLDPFRHPAGGGNPSPVAIFIIPMLSMMRRE